MWRGEQAVELVGDLSLSPAFWVFLFNEIWILPIANLPKLYVHIKWREIVKKQQEKKDLSAIVFNPGHSRAPVSCFLLLPSPQLLFFLPLFATRDHVSPLDPCWNMDDEMREMRAYSSPSQPDPLHSHLVLVIQTLSVQRVMRVLFVCYSGGEKHLKSNIVHISHTFSLKNHRFHLIICWLNVCICHWDLNKKQNI